MDIQIKTGRQKLNRRLIFAGLAVLFFILLIAIALWMGQRAPAIQSDQIWTGQVTRGELVEQVAASGRLIAPEIRAVATRADGLVEQVKVLPGDRVEPDDVLINMTSPQLELDLAAAQWELAGEQAARQLEQVEAENARLNLIAEVASAEADYSGASMELEAQEQLGEGQVFSRLEVERTRLNVAQLKKRLEARQSQLDRNGEVRQASANAAEARSASIEDRVRRLAEQFAGLEVKAGFSGVVQEINVQEGERLGSGHAVARIVNPDYLIARVRVSERDAERVQLQQPVTMELGRQRLYGSVIRIDPTVRDRLVDVDVSIDAGHSINLRPDLSVTARIELDRLDDVLLLDRPVIVRDEVTQAALFRLNPSGNRAERINVEFGRKSIQQVEIRGGLEAGDEVILSDLTEWQDQSVLRIR